MYTIETCVYASHTNANGCLKLASVIDMMQDCSQMWLQSEPALERFFKETNSAQVLVTRQVDLLRTPAYGEKLSVTTSVYQCRGYYGHRNTIIRDAAGALCAASWSIGAFVSLENDRLVRLPAEIPPQVVMDPQFDMAYLDKKIALPDVAFEVLPATSVRRDDIDFNRHMNNARYVQAAMEYLPNDFEPTRLRVEYKKPAKQGDALIPRRATAAGAYYIQLTDADASPHAVLEFSTL